jgi:thrombospondin 2/3/4/5
VKTGIDELMKMMTTVQKELAYQNAEIKYVQSLIENCASCKIAVEIDTCASANPCFPGAECFDTANGILCGNCPRGFKGDGKECFRIEMCSDRPCFA